MQSLLAEITSVISLIFEVARQISIILCDKKMGIDIIRSLLDKDKNSRVSTHNYQNIKKIHLESIIIINKTTYQKEIIPNSIF